MEETLREFAQMEQDEELCIEMIKYCPEALKYCKIQTPKIIDETMTYICLSKGVFQYVKDPTEEMCLYAIKHNVENILCIKDLTDEFILKAIRVNPNVIGYVEQTEERCLLAVSISGPVIKRIKNQTPEIHAKAIERTCCAISKMKNPSLKLQEYVMDTYPEKFSLIPDPHPDIIQRALDLDVFDSVKRITNKTPELCAIAFAKDPLQIVYIPDEYRTEEMWIEALKINGECLLAHPTIAQKVNPYWTYDRQINRISGEMPPSHFIEIAAKTFPRILEALPRQPDELCFDVLRKNPWMITQIPDPSDDMWQFAISINPEITIYYENATEEQLFTLITKDPWIMLNAKNPSLDLWLHVVKLCPGVGAFEPAPAEARELAYRLGPDTLKYCKQDIETIEMALELSPNKEETIACIRNPVWRRRYQ